MLELDEIIHAALIADPVIARLTGNRIYSTCVEVPPHEEDNTPTPYIVITDDAYTNDVGTKDDAWESDWDRVQAGIIINAASPADVKTLRRLVRQAIAKYVSEMTDGIPQLVSSTNDGIAWDWSKPCYYDTLHYSADMMRIYESKENQE